MDNNFFQTRIGNDFVGAVLSINRQLGDIANSLRKIADAKSKEQKAEEGDNKNVD